MYNKKCDETYTDLKLKQERRWKFYATNPASKPSQ
jgi:hypothetical protein